MSARMKNLINVIATGFIVMVLLSLALFYGRFLFWSSLTRDMPEDSLSVIIRPSGLFPGEPSPLQAGPQNRIRSEPPGPNEPNFRYSQIYVGQNREVVIGSAAGAVWDIIADVFKFRGANEKVYYWYRDENNYICLDKRSGLINRRYMPGKFQPNDENISLNNELFFGPNGVSQTASTSLGRFYDPMLGRSWDPNRMGFYDRTLRRFYTIDFVAGTVNKSPQLAEGDSREPIYRVRDIVFPALNIELGALNIWNAEESEWKEQKLIFGDAIQSGVGYQYLGRDFSYTFIPWVSKTGRVYICNTKEGSLVEAGYLPKPWSLYSTGVDTRVANPRDVLGYGVRPIYASLRLPADPNKPPQSFDVKYLGMCVGTVSREGASMAVAVFDANGRQICRGDTKKNGMPTAEYMYSETHTPLATISLFLLENLQPPVFEAASYLYGNCIEASAGHRALFILPNSFVGMLGRYSGTKFDRQVFLPLLMGPSLILSIWLAFRVRKDAKIIGLSGTAKKWWTIGTIAFGLSAYITYRLTRPKETLVTCQNCGQLRRPDMERCHRCGSKWEIPELTPPNWRICD